MTAARLKAMGVRGGFPDLTLGRWEAVTEAFAIELKASRGKPTLEQLSGWATWAAWGGSPCCAWDSMRHGRRSMTTSRDPNHPSGSACRVARPTDGRGAKNPAACWHMGRCDICRQDSSVTQVRDFGQLRSKLEEGSGACNTPA